MIELLWSSTSAMQANQEKLDTISNNIANASTSGYKKLDVNFQSLMSQSLDGQGYPISSNSKRTNDPSTGTGVKASEEVRDNSQGELVQSGNPTDLAIDGEGYFKLARPDGTAAYSRAGSFTIDGNGKLADSNGDILSINYTNGNNQNNVKFTQSNFAVNDKGDISIDKAGVKTKVGTIPLFNAIGDNAMVSAGGDLYVPSSNAKIYAATDSSIKQGFTENSNVDLATEMSDMLITQRAFQLDSKGINIADQMWQMANNLTK